MTTAELQSRTLKRIGDDPNIADPTLSYYRPSEVLTALNQAQRFFVLMTLCLETTATMQLTGAAFYRMLTFYADWIVPLRVRSSTRKIRPIRLVDLAALDVSWTTQLGTPQRYAHLGFDLMAMYKRDSSLLTVTYARSPVEMTAASTPEIPPENHQNLIDGAIVLLRLKEGQQEWQKVLPLWDRFMQAVQECAGYIRARNIEQGYDTYPVELKRFDQSKVLRKAS